MQEVVKRVQPLLLEPDFTYAVMKTKSAAAANLCNWVINIINFNQVSVLPERAQGGYVVSSSPSRCIGVAGVIKGLFCSGDSSAKTMASLCT